MNIFIFDENPATCARYHSDRHVVKMVLETAQILSTVHYLCGGEGPYKKTHEKHPCVLWVLESKANYAWLVELGLELAREYTHRYGKEHKSQAVIEWCAEHVPELPDVPRTAFALAMPEEYRSPNAVESYRRYFCGEKPHLGRWTKREVPQWFVPGAGSEGALGD